MRLLIAFALALSLIGIQFQPVIQIQAATPLAGFGGAIINYEINVTSKAYGGTDGGGDDRAAVLLALAQLSDGDILNLGRDIHLSAGVTITNSNIKIIGGDVTCTAVIDGPLITLTGTNVSVQDIQVNGANLAQRLFYQAPGSSVRWDSVRGLNAYQSSGQTAVPCIWRIAGETDTILWNCYADGVNAAQNGNAVGVFLSKVGSEGAPKRFQMWYSTITNVVPVTDADAWRIQNDWTEDCNVLLVANNLTGAKRGIKSMSPGGRAFYNHIYSPGYAAISCYASNWDYGWNTSHDDAGDMAFEVGSSVLSLTNVNFSFNKATRDPSSSIASTGDGGRMTGINNQNVAWIRNEFRGHRIGLNVTGGAHGTIVQNNAFFDVGQNAIRFAKQTVSSVDYFPFGGIISGNQFTNIASTPISIIEGTDISIYANILRGNGTVLGLSTCTNILQFGNFSKTDIGWATGQFSLSTSGQPVIKDGAVLTNIQVTSIGVDRSAPGGGGLLAAQRAADFLYSLAIHNTSSGAGARAGVVLQNDLSNSLAIQMTGSGYSSGTNEAQFALSSTNTAAVFYVAGEAFRISRNGVFSKNSTVSTNFTVTDSIQADKDATAGNTRFLIYDVDNGTLERVSVGAADSGGAGFKVLRIAN